MKRKTYILLSLVLTALIGAAVMANFSAWSVSAQKSDAGENIGGVVTEYNARSEFALTQGGTTGVWRYGYTANDASNAFLPYALTATNICGGLPADGWIFSNSGDTTPVLYRYQSPAGCNGTPPDSLFVHPGSGGERVVLRFVAPAAGTYQLTGALQRANPVATTDIRILKNETTSLFTGNVNSVFQQSFNLTVTVAANDTIDFSVGYGNGVYFSDGSSLNVTVSQPSTACLTAPANLQVNVPAENSPVDVQSVNTNAQLVGDAAYMNLGKVGRAFDFDGAGDYVRIEDNAAQRPANAVTVEGWFKFDSIGGLVSLVSKPLRNSAFNSYSLYLDGGQLRGFAAHPSQYTRVFSNFTPQIGVWHHLAFTYDFTGGVSTLKLYANGVEVTSGQDGTPNLPLYYDANPFPLLIGGEYENNAPGFYQDGQADEVSIYGRALSQTEIFNIVKQGSFGKCPPAACTQAPNGLVSWYQGDGSALDARANNHGTINGATFSNGKVGQALSFDGNDNISIANDASINPQFITLEAWIQPAAPGGLQTIAAKFDHGTFDNTKTAYNLALEGDTIRWQINSTGLSYAQINSPSQPQLFNGQFHHVAATYDGTVLKIYVDGVLVQNTPFAGGALYVANNVPLYLGGARSSGTDNYFYTGKIDEASIYDRALSAAEIQSIFNAGQSGKCKPSPLNPPSNLVGFWTADGDARDFAGENQNGANDGVSFAVGRVGQAFNFTADPQNVSIPDSAAMRPVNFTVEAWTKSLNNGGVRHIFAKTLGTGVSDSYVFWVDNGSLNGAICQANNNCFQISTAAPNTGEWHHLALSFDDASDSLRLYVDGVQATSGTTGLSIGYDTHPVLIGADYGNEVIFDSWRGLIDEVSFYDRALTQPELAAVYNAGSAGKPKAKTVNVTPPAITKDAERANLLAPATVQLSDATVTFANLTSSGTVSENGVDLGLLPPLPSSVRFTGLAYDLRTTAGHQQGAPDDVQVCFNVPALAALNFANLRIFHLENGVWFNRSAAANTSPNLCTDNLSTLSPFVIVEALAPTAAAVSVSGRVADASGAALGGVSVSLTDSQGRSVSTRTNNFGRYSFTGVAAGEVYVVSVASKRYTFGVSSQAVSVQDAVENIDFTADSDARRFDETKP